MRLGGQAFLPVAFRVWEGLYVRPDGESRLRSMPIAVCGHASMQQKHSTHTRRSMTAWCPKVTAPRGRWAQPRRPRRGSG